MPQWKYLVQALAVFIPTSMLYVNHAQAYHPHSWEEAPRDNGFPFELRMALGYGFDTIAHHPSTKPRISLDSSMAVTAQLTFSYRISQRFLAGVGFAFSGAFSHMNKSIDGKETQVDIAHINMQPGATFDWMFYESKGFSLGCGGLLGYHYAGLREAKDRVSLHGLALSGRTFMRASSSGPFVFEIGMSVLGAPFLYDPASRAVNASSVSFGFYFAGVLLDSNYRPTKRSPVS